MFLSRIPYQAVRKQRIRHWLLFALRCLALIFLALAFARPFLDRPAAAAPVRSIGARELVILLDRSYSMDYDGRWARAVDGAKRAIAGLGGNAHASPWLVGATADAATEPTAHEGVAPA